MMERMRRLRLLQSLAPVCIDGIKQIPEVFRCSGTLGDEWLRCV